MFSTTYPTFSPYGSVSANATSSSGATAVAIPTTVNGKVMSGGDTVRVVNTGTGVAYIQFGVSADATVATVNSIALLPGVIEVFDPAGENTHFALYAPTGTISVNVTSGVGA